MKMWFELTCVASKKVNCERNWIWRYECFMSHTQINIRHLYLEMERGCKGVKSKFNFGI